MTKKLHAVASAGASALARFFAIWRLRSSICGASSSSLALSRKESSPPRWSTVRSALADTRTRKPRPSESEISVTLRRFGRNRRLVLWLEWLTLWPTRGFLPVRSQRHDMAHPSKSADAKAAPVRSIILEDGRTYRERGAGRQAEDLSRFYPVSAPSIGAAITDLTYLTPTRLASRQWAFIPVCRSSRLSGEPLRALQVI